MANEGGSTANAFWRDFFSAGLYKRSQGRIARQATFGVLLITAVLGAWSLKEFLTDKSLPLLSIVVDAKTHKVAYDRVNGVFRLGFPLVFAVVGGWLAFRLVNRARFADFLIAVEAEMAKVSWPSRRELYRSSLVVLITMFGLAAVLYAYDIFWQFLLHALGVLQIGS